jgi:hypothetical protein
MNISEYELEQCPATMTVADFLASKRQHAEKQVERKQAELLEAKEEFQGKCFLAQYGNGLRCYIHISEVVDATWEFEIRGEVITVSLRGGEMEIRREALRDGASVRQYECDDFEEIEMSKYNAVSDSLTAIYNNI